MVRSCAILFLLLAVPRAEADVVFDFTGVCQSGDCDPGSVVTAALHFADDASLSHRDRLVTADDYSQLVVDYFVPIQRARATSTWSPTTEDTPILPIEVVIDPLGLLRGLLLRDEMKNRFQVDDIADGGGWEYRHVRTAPDGATEIDLTLTGIGGAFAPRRASVPEPATPLLVGLALALTLFQSTRILRKPLPTSGGEPFCAGLPVITSTTFSRRRSTMKRSISWKSAFGTTPATSGSGCSSATPWSPRDRRTGRPKSS